MEQVPDHHVHRQRPCVRQDLRGLTGQRPVPLLHAFELFGRVQSQRRASGHGGARVGLRERAHASSAVNSGGLRRLGRAVASEGKLAEVDAVHVHGQHARRGRDKRLPLSRGGWRVLPDHGLHHEARGGLGLGGRSRGGRERCMAQRHHDRLPRDHERARGLL
eukprot:884605-Rhodomonas_salina.1